MSEIWKDVIDYKGYYEVSNLGRVRSLPRYDRLGRFHAGKVLSDCDNGSGYRVVGFNVNGKQCMKTIHKLVATAFIDNPENKPCVNHIDGNKLNNNVTNLEWVTYSENMYHAVNTGLNTDFGRKRVMCVETGQIFSSTREAEKWAGIKSGNGRISSCCYGRRGAKTCGGYHWRYVD